MLSSPRAARADSWPLGWVASTSTAIVACALWQQAPGWASLVVALVASASAVWMLPTMRRPRGISAATVALLAITVTVAVGETATLFSVRRDWAAWSAGEREDRAQRVAASLTDVASTLRRVAEERVLDTLNVASPPLEGAVESALLVFRNGTLVARAGQTRTPIMPGAPVGVRLVDGAFHTSLVARARSADGRVEAVTVALVSSAPPADRFARPLLRTLSGRVDVAHTIIESPDSTNVAVGSTVVVVPDGPNRLARVRALSFSEGETQLSLLQRARARTNLTLGLALLGMLIGAWRRPARTGQRVAAAAAAVLAIAVAPLTALSNVSALFDPASYFAAMGGPLTSNVAALLMTTALALAVLLLVLRTSFQKPSRWIAAAVVIIVASGGPFLLRDLARGIALPAAGAGFGLWIAWQLALALAGVSILLAGAAAGQAAHGPRRGLPSSVAPLLALITGVFAPILWDAPGGWPAWYPALWVAAIGSLALTRRGLAQVAAAAVVAGAGAATLTWGATVRARMALAQHDLERIEAVDENAYRLLERFATAMREETRPVRSTDALLRRYAASELALAGYPARLARWVPGNSTTPVSELSLAPVNDTIGAQAVIATMARESGVVEIRAVGDGPTTLLVAAVPAPDSVVTTIAVPPRTRLLPLDPFAAFTGVTGARGTEAPYRLTLAVPLPGDSIAHPLEWRRRGDAMHGDGVAGTGIDVRRVHVEVDLRTLDVLLPRGALLVLLDVIAVMLLWSATALADGALGRLLRVRRVRWSRSYRVRLSGALLAFFIVPATIFAAWAWYRLQDDDRAARELLVRETLRVAAAEQEQRSVGTSPSSTGAPLFLYRDGQLVTASDSLLDALAPLGRLLPVSLGTGDFSTDDFGTDDVFATRRIAVGDARTLVGFRHLAPTSPSVLATPARGDEFALDARREDLGILLLFATMIGALAALWSSGLAARSLARPVGALREAALAIAAGGRAPALGTAPATEFAPVYRAFGRMADDLATSRAALEAAQRRTEAVLQHVASGVLALRSASRGAAPGGDILIANPRAEAMLGVSLRTSGVSLHSLPVTLAPLVERSTAFLSAANDEEAFELLVLGRQVRARLTRLPSGAVLTLDDVTELASAQRVLAWGEMARQVAHEIKNPLTPIRLGVQHLLRAYRDKRGDFGEILDTNVSRVLAEIDHLDEIARAFSRYGTAPEDRTPAVPVDVAAVVLDVMALERLGEDGEREAGIRWHIDAPEPGAEQVVALALRDELKEVLLNVLENARLAGAGTVVVHVEGTATHVVIDVKDDGSGIPADVLPQVFEPHFSTRTSGSGLGLAISRRLIEGWGGTIGLTSTPGDGTTVRLTLRRATRR
ncbi:ATP-binding protein [Gemmatimonas sp.]|uniref:ATP-binding protein n=1 Tax=Gemmatimonas sp. TaxID=1962908 RepID=UPI00286B0D5E|nr:ATP-binding protein [Gemmatimonas sp.]